MAYRLFREVLDHAPPALTSGERVVLLAIAEFARGSARSWTGEQRHLAHRTGLTDAGVRRVLGKLAANGIDVRVPIGTDRHGVPLYAVPGTSPTFRVPPLAPDGCACWSCAEGEPGGTPYEDKASRTAHLGEPSGTPSDDKVSPAARQPCRTARPLRTGSVVVEDGEVDETDPLLVAQDAQALHASAPEEVELRAAAALVAERLSEDPDVAEAAVAAWLAECRQAGKPIAYPRAYVDKSVQTGKPGQLRKHLAAARAALKRVDVSGSVSPPTGNGKRANRPTAADIPPCGECSAPVPKNPRQPFPGRGERMIYDPTDSQDQGRPCPNCHPDMVGRGDLRAAS